MLPVFKVFSLLIKIFSKPMVNYTKRLHLIQKHRSQEFIRRFFIYLGNKYHVFETKLNRKFLNLNSDFAFRIKPLNDEDAATKGVEFFWEVILYGLLIMVPLYEMNRGQVEVKEKSSILNKRIEKIEDGIENIKGEIRKESENLTEKIISFKVFVDEFEKNIENTNIQAKNDSEELKNDIRIMLEKTGELAKEINANRKELMEKATKLFEQQNGILNLLNDKQK